MNLYVDLDSLQLRTSGTDARNVRILNMKRGDALPLEVRFYEGGSQVRLDATTAITFVLKEEGKYDGDALVLENSFSASPVGSPDSDPHYTATPSLNTTALNDLFLINNDPSDDPVSLDLMGEISWLATGDTGPTTIKTFTARVENDIYRGTEGTPLEAATPSSFLDDENASRGIQPKHTRDNVFPDSLTIEGSILGAGDTAIALEALPFQSLDANGAPTYQVTTAEGVQLTASYNSGSTVWELAVDFGGSPASVTYQSSTTSRIDPSGVEVDATGRTSVQFTNTDGSREAEIGDVVFQSTDKKFFRFDGETWNEINKGNGFIDYNHNGFSVPLTSGVWTTVPNNGLGAFTNKNYSPKGVPELMDTSTGSIDPTDLDLGDTILIRNDFQINPNTNNALLEMRYQLGGGAGAYTLETVIGRLDDGSGKNYRFALKPDLIYMGDTNTRDNPITLQVKLSTAGTLTNAGSVIQVIRI